MSERPRKSGPRTIFDRVLDPVFADKDGELVRIVRALGWPRFVAQAASFLPLLLMMAGLFAGTVGSFMLLRVFAPGLAGDGSLSEWGDNLFGTIGGAVGFIALPVVVIHPLLWLGRALTHRDRASVSFTDRLAAQVEPGGPTGDGALRRSLFLHRRASAAGRELSALAQLLPRAHQRRRRAIRRRVALAAAVAWIAPAAFVLAALAVWALPAPMVVLERFADVDTGMRALRALALPWAVTGVVVQRVLPTVLLRVARFTAEHDVGHFEATLDATGAASGAPFALSVDVTPAAADDR